MSDSFANEINNLCLENEQILGRLTYWKTRCELSEAYIKETPCDPDVTPEQANAWQAWMDFIKDNE